MIEHCFIIVAHVLARLFPLRRMIDAVVVHVCSKEIDRFPARVEVARTIYAKRFFLAAAQSGKGLDMEMSTNYRYRDSTLKPLK